jgi:hypothetical protein
MNKKKQLHDIDNASMQFQGSSKYPKPSLIIYPTSKEAKQDIKIIATKVKA